EVSLQEGQAGKLLRQPVRAFGRLADGGQTIRPRVQALEEVVGRVVAVTRDAEVGDAHLAGGPHRSPELPKDLLPDAHREIVLPAVESAKLRAVDDRHRTVSPRR